MAQSSLWRPCNSRFHLLINSFSLASVNFCLALVGATQVTRVLMYQSSLKNESIVDEIKDEAKKDAAAVKQIVQDPKAALKKVEAAK